MASMSIWKTQGHLLADPKSQPLPGKEVLPSGRHHFVHFAMRHSTRLPLSADLVGRSTRQFLRLFDYDVFLGSNHLALAKAQH